MRNLRIGIAVLGALLVLAAGFAGVWMETVVRAWLLTVGFAFVCGALLGTSRRFLVPMVLAAIMVVFGGISAVVAVPEPLEVSIERAKQMDKEDLEASIPAKGIETRPSPESFRYASMVTGVGGLALILAATLTAAFLAPFGPRRKRAPWRIERAGQLLVMFGFLGVIGALLRFMLTQLPVDDLLASFKSFWQGGTFLLLIATFAIPGFALWIQGMIGRDASWKEYLRPALWAALFLILLLPTGQRGFMIALAIMLGAILLGNGLIKVRVAVALAIAGIAVVGLMQALRNEITESNRVTFDGFISRAEPSQWRELYGSQLTSFSLTAIVQENRDELDLPNSFLTIFVKPIPRSIYPDKTQGFGQEFTERAFPEAAVRKVSFATPIFSEADYTFGPGGVIVVVAIFGVLVVLVDRRVVGRAPIGVEAVALATTFWTCLEFVRGDLANAVVFSAAWIIPLVIFSRSIGLRRDPPIARVVVDATQMAPRFSGIGRRLVEIGESLKREPLRVPVTVRCPEDTLEELESAYPSDTIFETPIPSSRPVWRRVIRQQLVAPALDRSDTLLISPADQAPVWGRSKLLFVIHDVRRFAEPDTTNGAVEGWYYRTVMSRGAARSDRLLTISEFSRGEIERNLRLDRPISIVEEPIRNVVPRSPDEVAGSPATFLIVGAIRKYKGLDTVVEALSVLKGRGIEASVVCVGDSEGDTAVLRGLKENAEALGVGDRWQTPGWLDDDQLEAQYQLACGTVNPSRYEGYGLAVTTSLAHGLPTIASDIPPHLETGGDGALYFATGDPEALAETMETVSDNRESRRKWAAAALERHRELALCERSWSTALTDFLDDQVADDEFRAEPIAGTEPASSPS